MLSVCGRTASQKCGNDTVGPVGEANNPDHDNLRGDLGNEISNVGGRPLRKRGGRVRFFLLILFLAFPTSAIADSHETCIDVLNAPPLIDVLTRNDGHDSYMIDARKSGFGLIGSSCTVEALTEYFETAGWEFVSVTRRSEPSGPVGHQIEFYTDTHAKFCKKGRNLFTLYFRKCVQGVGVNFLEGEISFVTAGGIK
ncbi:MAG: hypothetical protein L3J30_02360 [Marinosulfonomonas sp.]|nr:hypothetical protein [Marinosulfonomonas sp.]